MAFKNRIIILTAQVLHGVSIRRGITPKTVQWLLRLIPLLFIQKNVQCYSSPIGTHSSLSLKRNRYQDGSKTGLLSIKKISGLGDCFIFIYLNIMYPCPNFDLVHYHYLESSLHHVRNFEIVFSYPHNPHDKVGSGHWRTYPSGQNATFIEWTRSDTPFKCNHYIQIDRIRSSSREVDKVDLQNRYYEEPLKIACGQSVDQLWKVFTQKQHLSVEKEDLA